MNVNALAHVGAAWDVKLGRIDNADGATKSIISPNSGSEESRKFMLELGAKPGLSGPFSPKPPFWERVSFVLLGRIADDPEVHCHLHLQHLQHALVIARAQFPACAGQRG